MRSMSRSGEIPSSERSLRARRERAQAAARSSAACAAKGQEGSMARMSCATVRALPRLPRRRCNQSARRSASSASGIRPSCLNTCPSHTQARASSLRLAAWRRSTIALRTSPRRALRNARRSRPRARSFGPRITRDRRCFARAFMSFSLKTMQSAIQTERSKTKLS
jgi:hypothetical protein